MLGFVYYKTNNVFATIIIHAIHNSWVTFLGLIMEGLEYTPDSSYDGLVVKLISVSLMVAFASASPQEQLVPELAACGNRLLSSGISRGGKAASQHPSMDTIPPDKLVPDSSFSKAGWDLD